MTTFAEGYDEVESFESFDFESADEAARPFRPGGRVFAPGGLSSATLHTPKGPAKLNLPSPVPTLTQFRTLEQALNANTQRVNAVQNELTRQGLTAYWLADAAGVTNQSIYRWLAGKGAIRSDTLAKLFVALDLDVLLQPRRN